MPQPGEYPPYYEYYIKRVNSNDVLEVLNDQLHDTSDFLKTIPSDRGAYRYADGKWSVKELINHVIDTERILAYRALRFARNDSQPLPGFEENDYARHSNADKRSISDLAEEFKLVRQANLVLFSTFDEPVLKRLGTGNNYHTSVRAILYMIAGHELHHIGILKERYLS